MRYSHIQWEERVSVVPSVLTQVSLCSVSLSLTKLQQLQSFTVLGYLPSVIFNLAELSHVPAHSVCIVMDSEFLHIALDLHILKLNSSGPQVIVFPVQSPYAWPAKTPTKTATRQMTCILMQLQSAHSEFPMQLW